MGDDKSGDQPRIIAGMRSHSLVPSATGSGSALGRPDNRVIINVGGVRYETYKSTLKNIPDTRLSWLTETTAHNSDYDPALGEYFFDRHPGVFNMILNYYRTGKLHAPTDVCGPLFEDELAFWGIDEKQIEPCCWMTYMTHRDAQETLAEFDDGHAQDDDEDEDYSVAHKFGIEEEAGPNLGRWERWRPRLWSTLEEPRSSKVAQAVAVISLSMVIVSIGTFCMETHVAFRVPRNSSDVLNYTWTHAEKTERSEPQPWLTYLEYVMVGFFTIELIFRFICCPNKKEFFKKILNWVDILSLLPVYIELIMIAIDKNLNNSPAIQFLKAFRLIRIFRIFKLTRHFSGLKILAHTIKASARELLLLILFLLIGILIFACLVYYAEVAQEHPKNFFKSIPLGFWWAVVTMTTVGYGDIYPRTALGYLVGSVCAVCGVLIVALPVPVIVNNFALYYSHAQARMKLPKKRKKVLVGAADALKTQLALPTGSLRDERPLSPAHSDGSLRKGSNDSVIDSMDSGIKTNSSASSETTGISVIFTDEIASSPNHQKRNKVIPQPERRQAAAVSRRRSLMPNGNILTINPSTTPLEPIQEKKSPPAKIPKPPPRRHSLMPPRLVDIDV